MMRKGVVTALAFLTAAMLAGCLAARPKPSAAVQIVTAANSQPGEQTQPLPIVYGAAVDPGRALPPARLDRALPTTLGNTPVAAANGTAYYYGNGVLTALDLTTAQVRWHRAVAALASYTYGSDDGFTASPHSIVFQTLGSDSSLLSLDAATGATQFSIPHARAGGAIDGVLFAADYYSSPAYIALDEKTGQRLWKSYGGGGQVSGPPQIRNGVLLQPFIDDGAILENAIYAFDPKTGHARWEAYVMQPPPIGFRGNTMYVDATWFPEQADRYVPLTVDRLDLASGKRLDSYTYAPDPERNSATFRNSPILSYVTGGYVYLRVNGMWYRYDADREPASAHPANLPNIDIGAAFEGGTLLVTRDKRAFLAHADATRMMLNPLPNGELKSPVVAGPGTVKYAVAGSMLYRFDSHGTPFAIGSVNCANRASVAPWPSHVAVLCDGRERLFADQTQPVPALALAPRHAPPGHLQLNAFAIPPPGQGMNKQWWVGPMVPWQNGGVVMWLDRGDMSLAGSLAFVNRDGHISTMRAGKDIAPPKLASPAAGTVSPLRMPPHIEWPAKPSAIVYDTAGNVWFNNAWDATLTKIDPAGHVTTLLMGEKQTGRPPGLPIRLTLGPDGAAWFARSHPTSEIARVDGSRAFAIPSRYGDVLALVPMGINGFWFVTKTQLVELTLAGKFVSALSLPAELQTIHNDPPLLTAGPNDTVWIARGSYLANMNENGVLGQYTLPDATLGVRAMVSGCDGSLYVAESAPEVLRLPRNGKTFERYSIEYRQIDGFTRTDCTIWFVEGSNMPAGQQNVGTLSLK